MNNTKTVLYLLVIIALAIALINANASATIFRNYALQVYLEELDEELSSLSKDLSEVKNKEEFLSVTKQHYEVLKPYCYLSSKLYLTDKKLKALDTKNLSDYLLDINGYSESISEDEINLYINDFKRINDIQKEFIKSNPKDYYGSLDTNIRIKFKPTDGLVTMFNEINTICNNGINTFD